MARKYEAGEKLTGKVTGIQPYGAFVSLDEEHKVWSIFQKSRMVL